MTGFFTHLTCAQKKAALSYDGPENHGSQGHDERPGDYLVGCPAPSRYPPPAEAELITLWKKDRRVVMSVTAGGQTQDFYMPPARLVYLLRECAEQLAENSILH